MPELPEVETTLRGLSPHLLEQTIIGASVRESRLRWPIPLDLNHTLEGLVVNRLQRRGKYLLLRCGSKRKTSGTLILHLGMSGNLRIATPDLPLKKHDHLDIQFRNKVILRFNDPRRFGAVLWTTEPPEQHSLLCHLGPEPLETTFNTPYLFTLSRTRSVNIKSFIMNSRVVVGVGNIYANEALFRSGIHPQRKAGSLSKKRLEQLVKDIKTVLSEAIEQGGTTLRDFTSSDGKPGYFSQKLAVYGRYDEPCIHCGHPLSETRIAQRATYFCHRCQT